MTVFRRWRKGDPDQIRDCGTVVGPFGSCDPGGKGVVLFFRNERWPEPPAYVIPLAGDLDGVHVAATAARTLGIRFFLCEKPYAARPRVVNGKLRGDPSAGVMVGVRAGIVIGHVLEAAGATIRDVSMIPPSTWQARQKRAPYFPHKPDGWAQLSTKERSRATFDRLYPGLLDAKVRRKPYREAAADAWGLADGYFSLTGDRRCVPA